MAQRLIASLPNTGDLLFTASRSQIGGKPTTTVNGWLEYKREFDDGIEGGEPYKLHDLRRTFSSQLVALGTPIHVTEKLLNHVSGSVSGVAAVYNCYSSAAEMRTAVEAHEVHLAKVCQFHPPVVVLNNDNKHHEHLAS